MSDKLKKAQLEDFFIYLRAKFDFEDELNYLRMYHLITSKYPCDDTSQEALDNDILLADKAFEITKRKLKSL